MPVSCVAFRQHAIAIMAAAMGELMLAIIVLVPVAVVGTFCYVLRKRPGLAALILFIGHGLAAWALLAIDAAQLRDCLRMDAELLMIAANRHRPERIRMAFHARRHASPGHEHEAFIAPLTQGIDGGKPLGDNPPRLLHTAWLWRPTGLLMGVFVIATMLATLVYAVVAAGWRRLSRRPREPLWGPTLLAAFNMVIGVLSVPLVFVHHQLGFRLACEFATMGIERALEQPVTPAFDQALRAYERDNALTDDERIWKLYRALSQL